jgi:Zn ribbon nucleic-acid-binding protein
MVKRWKSLLQLSCIFAACVIAVIAQTAQQPSPGPQQPIAFSHKLHAGANNLKCATCHKNPDPGERMGLASAAMCMQCHSDIKTDSPEVQKIAAHAKDNREIKWRRVYEIPSYVFFSHRAHLTAGATCTTCHGEVKEMEQMYKAKEINMASCMNCHSENKASTDCLFCHEKMN